MTETERMYAYFICSIPMIGGVRAGQLLSRFGIFGVLFFVFMTFAAQSTIIAVFENIISFYMDMGGWSRKKAVILKKNITA